MLDNTNQNNLNTKTTEGLQSSVHQNKDETTKKGYSGNQKPKTVHAVLASKGGVGKSFVASLLTQYLREMGEPLVVLDADPLQNTIANVPGLGATAIQLLDGERINVDVMDKCIGRIFDEDSSFLIDCGAAGFVPFCSFMLRDSIFDAILAEGKKVFIHGVVAGGPLLMDTTLALADMTSQFPERVNFVCWQNEFWGPLSTADGRTFEGGPWWESNKDRFSGTVRVPLLDPHYAGAAVQKMLTANMTFAEALASAKFERVTKMRLQKVWNEIKTQIWAAI